MARYIDADAIDLDRVSDTICKWQAQEAIDDAPIADVVEVVRCKDCKFYDFQNHQCEGIGNWFGFEDEWSDNGFCYKGERSEDVEETD